MPFPAGFLDDLRARTPLTAVIGRTVKLGKSGREWVGLCPFHNEKSPSFRVYDDHYHCFGCGKHGDAIDFVMETQGATFPEAVAQLAAEAGLEVPRATPGDAEAEQRRAGLHDMLAGATRVFARRLRDGDGSAALAYLRRRGVSDAAIARFDLGWSGRGSLLADLQAEGATPALLAEAGLARAPEDGGDFFFNRIMFPIRDRAGRAIGFGGRTLGDGQPKYINGPETPLFAKRRTLYGLDLARGRAKGQPVIAVEGYLDVIALHEAGFGGAVAPLGTALTEEHLAALWRLDPLPVLCFDGDAAGARAAVRAVELALPLLAPERSLKLASLPAGEDPDSLLRGQGVGAMRAVLDAARPLADALFDLFRAAAPETPEGRAVLRHRLDAAAALVPDRALAAELRGALRDRFYAERRSRRADRTQADRTHRAARPAPPRAAAADPAAERARVLTAILLRHPALLPGLAESYERLTLPPDLAPVRTALLDLPEMLDSAGVADHFATTGLSENVARALADTPMPLPHCAGADAMPAEAEAGWWHYFGLLDPGGLGREVAEARRRFEATWDAATQRRLIALKEVQAALADDPGET